MANRKDRLIGAGNIGGELARLCANAELGDVASSTSREGKLREGQSARPRAELERPRYDAKITARPTGPTSKARTSSSSPPASRASPTSRADDLVATNLPIIRDSRTTRRSTGPNAFVIVISNPLDAMVYEYKRVTGCPKGMVAAWPACSIARAPTLSRAKRT